MRNYKNQFTWWKLVKNQSEYLLKIGFEDTSWGNDVSPSFELPGSKYRVWIDHPKDIYRESAGDQFVITKWLDEDDSILEFVFSSNSFNELLLKLDSLS
jgi:hypothetical protein